MTRSAVSSNLEVCCGEHTRDLNLKQRYHPWLRTCIHSLPASVLRSWGDEPPAESLVFGTLGYDKKWNKTCFLIREAVVRCGRKNTDLGVRLSGWKAWVCHFLVLALDTCSDSISLSKGIITVCFICLVEPLNTKFKMKFSKHFLEDRGCKKGRQEWLGLESEPKV